MGFLSPGILLLDEPTSGLDAFTAEHLCTVLHRLACTQQQAIALTIHQPGPEITRLFDHVLLLSSGHAVYNGPADDIIPYFDGLGYPLPKFTSPYDHYGKLSEYPPSIPTNTYDDLILQSLIDMIDLFLKSLSYSGGMECRSRVGK